jgi:hypothetical protein
MFIPDLAPPPRVVHPGSGSWRSTHPGFRSQKSTGSRIRIRNTGYLAIMIPFLLLFSTIYFF